MLMSLLQSRVPREYLSAMSSLHRFTVRICCETARNSCETAAKLAKHPVRNTRNTRETPAKHLRNTCETPAKHTVCNR